jgi:hypothetical protein
MPMTRAHALGLALGLALAPAAFAQPQQGPGGPGGPGGPDGRRGPPPEAFTACDGLAAGAPCAVTFREHRIQGTCARFIDQRMMCRPEGMPPRHPGGSGAP